MREIPVGRSGLTALVDDDDWHAVMSAGPWFAAHGKRTYYARRRLRQAGGRQSSQLMHMFLTGYVQTDHRNGNGLDNRRANLRDATTSQNQANRRPIGGSSRFKGVSWNKKNQKWMAYCKIDGEVQYLGLFSDERDAALAYDHAARELFDEFALLNFPGEDFHPNPDPLRGVSRFRGVSWHKHSGKWVARISVDGRRKLLGYYDEELDAALAYDLVARDLPGRHRRPNLVHAALSLK